MNKERSWIEIDQASLAHNYQQIKKMIKEDTQIIAVVKSNAYGHGAEHIVPYLASLGVKRFAVACLDEAIALRSMGITQAIMILGYTCIFACDKLLTYDLEQTVFDLDYAKSLPAGTKVHLKIDTGMHRLGVRYDDLEQISQIMALPNIKIKGVFSHLASSELLDAWHDDFTRQQLANFKWLHDRIKASLPQDTLFHILASYGLINYPEYQFNCVRCGMLFYGFLSSEDHGLMQKLGLKPVLSLKSRIAQIKKVKAGEYVGYDNRFRASKDMSIAIVAIGYYDGIFRSLSNTGHQVKVNDKLCTILGNICMDQLMIDVTNVTCQMDDEVCLIAADDNISAEKMAKHAGCLTNELLSRLAMRNIRLLK
ncbi:MAG: alanine racemase [Erysipelotrichaceae bacterium]|nr:alanine racemase [Erysipelotrichaceae bacterium]MDY5252650.1 alanine racemase [Erysipelotrichaceae bacterium]